MRKFVFLVGLLLTVVHNVQAQFILTPNGLKCEDNSDYIILTFEGKQQEELFNSVHLFAGSKFVSPHDVISVSGKEQITLNGVVSTIPWRNPVSKQCSVNFTITFMFKDGRIRINTPSINRIYTSGMEISLVQAVPLITDGVFKKNGSVYSLGTKEGIEIFFNTLVENVKQYIIQDTATDW